jgi:hypothetical protein
LQQAQAVTYSTRSVPEALLGRYRHSTPISTYLARLQGLLGDSERNGIVIQPYQSFLSSDNVCIFGNLASSGIETNLGCSDGGNGSRGHVGHGSTLLEASDLNSLFLEWSVFVIIVVASLQGSRLGVGRHLGVMLVVFGGM